MTSCVDDGCYGMDEVAVGYYYCYYYYFVFYFLFYYYYFLVPSVLILPRVKNIKLKTDWSGYSSWPVSASKVPLNATSLNLCIRMKIR